MAGRRWTPEEDLALEDGLGKVDVRYLARKLGRTMAAVRSHADSLGLSMLPDGVHSAYAIAGLVGRDSKRVGEWVDAGLLAGARMKARGRYGTYVITEEAFLEFLRTHPEMVERNDVDAAYRQFVPERWITLPEAFERGAAHVVSLEHAYRAGLLPEARRRGIWIVIPERVLPVLVAGRRTLTSDVVHRRMWMRYAATQRRRRPIRRQQWRDARQERAG